VVLRFSVRGGASGCRVDNRPFRRCAGGVRYSGLRAGAHTFVVRAHNRHGSTTIRVAATIPAPAPPRAPPKPGARPCGAAGTPPARWDHVVWIVFENKRYAQIIGSPEAPYLNSIARLCASAASFFAEAHPSLPNYIAMTSGSTQNITDDSGPSSHPLTVPSLFSQLGSRWRSLEEGMPSNCDLSDSGDYAERHNPAVYYTNIRAQCARQDVPLVATPDVSARFTFVTPNLCHDMHSSSCTSDSATEVRSGDQWVSHFLPTVLASPQYRAGRTAVFITWDEDDYSSTQHVATLVVAPTVPAGGAPTLTFNHYSLLRTTEEMLGLPLLGNAAHAPSMRASFHLG
jgi:phosphatidylinositol-3-phosphatase